MHRYIERFSKERDINELHQAIEDAAGDKGTVERLYTAYSSIPVVTIDNKRSQYIFISGGVHGDEPAGVRAAVNFICEADRHDKFNYLIIPCVNMVGYERNIREGQELQDINREFYYDTKSPENEVIIRYLARQPVKNFVFSMDLHETRAPDKNDEEYNHNMLHPRSFYMFEVCREEHKRIGMYISNAVDYVTPVCKWARIWGDEAHYGVITYPDGATGKLYSEANTFEKFMYDNYTHHSFTTETYSGKYGGNGENFDVRVQAQLTAIRTAVSHQRV